MGTHTAPPEMAAVPPKNGRFSKTTTESPSIWAFKAANKDMPEPATTMSTSLSHFGSSPCATSD